MSDQNKGGGASEAEPRRQLYGRSKGKALRAGQSERLGLLLPTLTIDLARLKPDPAVVFAEPSVSAATAPRPLPSASPAVLRLEIGFGGGEHLAAQAAAHPEIGFLGVEPFLNGVVKLLGAIAADGLANIRLLRGDGRDVLAALPDGSLDIVYLLYPDPWPKRRQRKRRIVDNGFLAEVARVLRPGGEFRFATDIDDYVGWTLARIARQDDLVWNARSADDWRTPWLDWHRTRYEAKALREGRMPGYFRFVRR